MHREHAAKRQRINADSADSIELLPTADLEKDQKIHSNLAFTANSMNLSSLNEPISPPLKKRVYSEVIDAPEARPASGIHNVHAGFTDTSLVKSIPSPIQLTTVEGLSAPNNIDTVSLQDILGDPLIKECWIFNYLFDVEFILSKCDEDIRDRVQIKIIHGSWKKEDSNRLHIEEATSQHANIQSITAFMPEAFGTHHSKMVINIRHDNSAQIIILTANMIPRDWRMCQAVWRSPILPFLSPSASPPAEMPAEIGSGARFKTDLMEYLSAYGAKLRTLTVQLVNYDFSKIRGALVASVPARQNIRSIETHTKKLWGWPGLRNILRRVPADSCKTPYIVMQVSSVASLGSGDTWLRETFLQTLSTTSSESGELLSRPKARFALVFPTADSIRRSIDGYCSGGSIHMKTQTPQGIKQLEYLRPLLCHWASDALSPSSTTISNTPTRGSKQAKEALRGAGRRRAAPHIKTYLRFSDDTMTQIDWAVITSANLSMQAWGAKATVAHEVRICSYEIGVVVWPGLWGVGTKMVPMFGKDMPEVGQHGDTWLEQAVKSNEAQELHEQMKGDGKTGSTRIGLRMPYDLPLVPYGRDEMPWCATLPDSTLDWMGRDWPGIRID